MSNPMTPTKGGKTTDLTFWSKLVTAGKYLIGKGDINTDVSSVPFGPSQPLPPVFQEGMEGRQFDYQTGFNLQYVPRQEEPITFHQLRALADGYDLMRLAIETVKDQICKIGFHIMPRDKDQKPDARCKMIDDFFRYPDKEHDYLTWERMLWEDLLVIDAPTILPRFTKGGDLYSLELMDGALIKRTIDAGGRTPAWPEVAYQQYIKGVPAVDYCRPDLANLKNINTGNGTMPELLYLPRNLRTNKVYGYSPVEQVIITVNIAIRRQLHQLAYYTEGNLPDLIFQCPPEWNPDQIKQFDGWFNSMLSGNVEERRRAKFVPNGVDPYDIKQNAIKDEYDDWLARIICFCFSLPPTAFIKQMNRAVADTAKETAQEEGITPRLMWRKAFIDLIIMKYFKSPDLHCVADELKDIDPHIQAQIDQIYLTDFGNGAVLSPQDVRTRLGVEGSPPEKIIPIVVKTDEQITDTSGGKVKVSAKTGDGSGDDKSKVEKVERAKKKIMSINRERKSIIKARGKLKKVFVDFFKSASKVVAIQIQKGLDNLQRTEADDDLQKILNEIDFSGWAVLIEPTSDILEEIYKDGSIEALMQIGFAPEKAMTSLLNRKALEFAETRAADLIGMRNIGTSIAPQWIINPDVEYSITSSTREMLRTTVRDAYEKGWSPQKLQSAIEDSTGFNADRAEMISRTELAFADSNGNMEAYRASGVVHGKEWIVGSGHDQDDECDDNEEAGVIPLDEIFPSGDDAPPSHPNCVCDVLPVVMEEIET